MKISANYKLETNIKVTVEDTAGNILDIQEFHNSIMDVGFNLLRDALKGDVSDCEIKYVAVGTDGSAIDTTDTTLGTETFRKIKTSDAAGATGVLTTTVYIAPAEAVAAIEEIGWFAGAAAGAGADSGVMVSRVLYSRNKTALESILIVRTDTISEV